MNRYPTWKYVLIALAILISGLYAVPNLFGEVPAVQVSGVRASSKVDAELQKSVEEGLQGANIPVAGMDLEETMLRVRFADTETQLRARDAVQTKVGPGYGVALNLVPNTPHWLQAIGSKPMYLGLDLRGGVHFLLQVDMKGAIVKFLDSSAAGIRSTLRAEEDARSSGITRDGNQITVRFREAANREKAQQIIERNYPDLELLREEQGSEFLLVGTLKQTAQKRIQ